MRCRECGAPINPTAVLCPGCIYQASQLARLPRFTLATPAPMRSNQRPEAPAKAGSNISWTTFALLFVSMRAISCVLAHQRVLGNTAKMTGYVIGHN